MLAFTIFVLFMTRDANSPKPAVGYTRLTDGEK